MTENSYNYHTYVFAISQKQLLLEFQEFSVIQNLREINFRESRGSKTTFFAILKPLNFVNLANYSLHKVPEIHENQILEPLNVSKWQILHF